MRKPKQEKFKIAPQKVRQKAMTPTQQARVTARGFQSHRALEAEGRPEPYDVEVVLAKEPTEIELANRRRLNFIRMRIAESFPLGLSLIEAQRAINRELKKKFPEGTKLIEHGEMYHAWQREYKHWRERVDSDNEQRVTTQFAKLEEAYRRAANSNKAGDMIRAVEAQNRLLGIEPPKKRQVTHRLEAEDIDEERRRKYQQLLDEVTSNGA